MLTWFNTEANYQALGMSGNLASWAYAIADAPYFKSTATTVDGIFSDLTTQLGSGGTIYTLLTYLINTAKSYGLAAVQYEGGQSLAADNGAGIQAQYDPRMAGIYEQYYDLWYSLGGLLANHFTLVGSWGTQGTSGFFFGSLPGQQYRPSSVPAPPWRPSRR